MGRLRKLFLDTPVLLERLAGRDVPRHSGSDYAITGQLNLMEVVHILIRRGQEEQAHDAYDRLEPLAENLNERRIFEVGRFRTKHADRGLSYADAAGYVTARELGAILVTPDRGFRGLPGVLFTPAPF